MYGDGTGTNRQLPGSQPTTDRRTDKRFAFLPTKIGEIRIWWKYYYIDQYYEYGYTRNSYPGMWKDFENSKRLTKEVL